jgi:hypothetical protein
MRLQLGSWLRIRRQWAGRCRWSRHLWNAWHQESDRHLTLLRGRQLWRCHGLVLIALPILAITFVAERVPKLQFGGIVVIDSPEPPTKTSNPFVRLPKGILISYPSPNVDKMVFARENFLYTGLRQEQGIAAFGAKANRVTYLLWPNRERTLCLGGGFDYRKTSRKFILGEEKIRGFCDIIGRGIPGIVPCRNDIISEQYVCAGEVDTRRYDMVQDDGGALREIKRILFVSESFLGCRECVTRIYQSARTESQQTGSQQGISSNSKSSEQVKAVFFICMFLLLELSFIVCFANGFKRFVYRGERIGIVIAAAGWLCGAAGVCLAILAVLGHLDVIFSLTENASGSPGSYCVSAQRYSSSEDNRSISIVIPEFEFRKVQRGFRVRRPITVLFEHDHPRHSVPTPSKPSFISPVLVTA